MTENLQESTIDAAIDHLVENADRRPPVNVLLIEDAPDDAFLVTESLKESREVNFVVECVERLANGLALLENEEIDVVLLDLSLPDSSGTKTFHRVYEQAPNVPIVVLTGLEDENLGAEVVREGGQDYLVKGQVNGTLLTRCISYAIERKRSERLIRRLAEESSVLAEIGRIISSSLRIDEVYEGFSEQVFKLIPYHRIMISLVDLDECTITDAVVFGTEVPERPRGGIQSLTGSHEAAVVQSRSGIHIEDLTVTERLSRYPDLEPNLQAGLASYLAVPLISKDQVIGVLQLMSTHLNAYTDDDLSLLERIGAQIAGAIANSQLYAQLKQAEESLKQQAKELTRSNHELEQFAYVASHDLQEPLRMVNSYVQFLASDYEGKLDEKADRYIHYAVDGAQRMKILIDDLLAFSRVGTQGKPFAPTNCNKVLRQVVADLEAVVDEKQAQVTWDPLPTVMGDMTQLTQLLRNLVSNGIKYCSEERPRVHVAAELVKDGAEHGERGTWRFSVHDNGIGISAEHFENIFRMFQRLHHRTEYPGTGIGLAICQKIVERHEGQIWVESEVGKGSTFFFSIPNLRTEEDKVAQESNNGSAADVVEVLLVEDNPGDVEMTERILKDSKFNLNINVAKDGELAMDFLRKRGAHANAPRPNLVLLDLNMPRMNGYQVLDKLKEDPELKDIPVMILTSTQGERDRLYGLGISPNRYCNKPLDLSRFDTLVDLLKSGAVTPATHRVAQPEEPEEQPKKRWWQFGSG